MAAVPATPVADHGFLQAVLYKCLHMLSDHSLCWCFAGSIMYRGMSCSTSYVGVWASVHSCGKLCLDGLDNDCGGHLPDIC